MCQRAKLSELLALFAAASRNIRTIGAMRKHFKGETALLLVCFTAVWFAVLLVLKVNNAF